MKTLILHPTDVGQWHALVNEAQAETQVILNEPTESYLVFLLMRFSQESQLIESVLALDFLEGMKSLPHRRIEKLREVGDKSLLFSGLFPDLAKKRHVTLEYFIEMGQAAYLTVSELHEDCQSGLFLELSAQFIQLQHILQALRVEHRAPYILLQ